MTQTKHSLKLLVILLKILYSFDSINCCLTDKTNTAATLYGEPMSIYATQTVQLLVKNYYR